MGFRLLALKFGFYLLACAFSGQWRLALVLFVVFGQLAFIAHATAINEPDLEVDTSDAQVRARQNMGEE